MRRRWLALAALAALAAIAGAGGLWASGLAGLAQAWLAMQGQEAEWSARGLWLPHYRVTVEAQPIAGLSDNVSGLTYSTPTGTLFTVINRPPAVAELTPDGRLLRTLPVTGATDPEGITHVAGDRFIISDEGNHKLSWIDITPGTTAIDLTDAPHLTIDLAASTNMGFEGISWDDATNRLIIVQEMWPVRVLTVTGIDAALSGRGLGLEVRDWSPSAGRAFLAADLSSVTLHEPTGNLILLSHVTAALFEYAPTGDVVSMMPLWRGWSGLAKGVPQAEGVAVGPGGDIFLVSEPNLFYRFSRSPTAGWALATGDN
jgi:uncharacterized protein YjiK